MPLSFPSSPTTGQTYTVGGRTWTWSGSVWELNANTTGVAAVGTGNIANSAVTTEKIADSAITTAKIAAGAVVEADIANNAVTQSKLATSVSLSGFKNRVINGDMRINQRGLTQASSFAYLVDRWRVYSGNNIVNLTTVLDGPSGFRNSIYAQCTTASGNSSYNGIVHQIEGFNIADAGFGTSWGLSITVSFWVKSNKTGIANFSLANSNNTRTYTTEYTISSLNTWEYKTLTIPVDTTNTGWLTNNGMGLRLWWDLGSATSYNTTVNTWVGTDSIRTTNATINITSTLNANLYLTGVQVEIGTQATPFEQRSYPVELGMCKRYYETSFRQGQAIGHNSGNFRPIPTNSLGCGGNSYFTVPFTVQKRTTTPTLRIYDPIAAQTTSENWWRFIVSCNSGTAVGPNSGVSLTPDDVAIAGYLQNTTGATVFFDWTVDAEI